MFKSNKIEEELIGIACNGHTYTSPSSYSALGRLKRLESEVIMQQKLISLLLVNLGYKLETGDRLVKVKEDK